jgi:hypothetical protein
MAVDCDPMTGSFDRRSGRRTLPGPAGAAQGQSPLQTGSPRAALAQTGAEACAARLTWRLRAPPRSGRSPRRGGPPAGHARGSLPAQLRLPCLPPAASRAEGRPALRGRTVSLAGPARRRRGPPRFAPPGPATTAGTGPYTHPTAPGPAGGARPPRSRPAPFAPAPGAAVPAASRRATGQRTGRRRQAPLPPVRRPTGSGHTPWPAPPGGSSPHAHAGRPARPQPAPRRAAWPSRRAAAPPARPARRARQACHARAASAPHATTSGAPPPLRTHPVRGRPAAPPCRRRARHPLNRRAAPSADGRRGATWYPAGRAAPGSTPGRPWRPPRSH